MIITIIDYIKHNHYNLQSIKRTFVKVIVTKTESVKNIEGISEVTVLIKGIVHLKLKMLASFTLMSFQTFMTFYTANTKRRC